MSLSTRSFSPATTVRQRAPGPRQSALPPANTSILAPDNLSLSGLSPMAQGIGPKFSAFQNAVQDGLLGIANQPFETRQITWRPGDVNHAEATRMKAVEQATTQASTAERAALAKLAPAERHTYSALVRLLEGRNAAKISFPLGRRAIQQLLLDGKLTSQRDQPIGRTLLDNLGALATEPLAPGILRAKVVSEAAAEVQDPSAIDQHSKATCVATTASIILAERHPAEYVRLVAGLAAPAGTVSAAGGDTLHRVPDWNNRDDGGRSTSQRLLIPALMNDGIPSPLHYDNTQDADLLGQIRVGAGLTTLASAHIESQLEGQPFKSHAVFALDREHEWKKLEQSLSNGQGPVSAGLFWSDSPSDPGGDHWVAVDAIKDGKVAFTNPWGDRETLSKAEFKSHLLYFEAPDA